MICGYVAKNLQNKRLVLNRGNQNHLAIVLWHSLGYQPFIYNTQFGLYVFLEEFDCNEAIEKEISTYLQLHSLMNYQFLTCHEDRNFFWAEMQSILTDQRFSSFSWKSFISSFLAQLKPFKGDTKVVHALFINFVKTIKDVGSKPQLDYLKHKMNLLRSRVAVSTLLDIDFE